MAHHSSDGPLGDDPRQKLFKKMTETPEARAMLERALAGSLDSEELRNVEEKQLGPTNKHPEPRLGPNDEGEIKFAIGTAKDAAGELKIILDFGTPVHSVGMNKEQAIDLGRRLITRAGCTCRVGYED